MNTSDFLTIASAIVPDREAIVFDDRRFTYEALSERVRRLANALAELGVQPGDRVATMQVNCNQLMETYFATAMLDALYVPLNYRARAEELTNMLQDSGPKVILAGQRYVPLVKEALGAASDIQRLVAFDANTAPDGWLAYEDLLAQASDDEQFPAADDDDVTVLMYTAGTTGVPRAVMLTHESFASYILENVSPADPDIEERNILTVPLYHIAGMQAALSAVYGGRTLIVQRQFEPVEWMRLVERERASRAMMVPTMLKHLMEAAEFGNHDLSSLEVITYGAAPMPLEVIKRAIGAFPGVRFINAFGQTETASTITMLPPEDHVLDGSPEEIERKLGRLASIGKPLGDIEIRIVDEDGADVPVGEMGEIVAKGPRLMKGYWNMEEATRQAMHGGWLHTGDLGYWDEDGYIFLAGRAKDMIKRGGEAISPEEVEQVLMAHPGVDEAAIIGVPDEEWGERVRAIVVAKDGAAPTAKELTDHCHERLASFKRPESVIFVTELPRNPLGKILKRVLREEHGSSIDA
ncbi:MAG: long-chain acyl-CoA synthetase [Chloroflexi bacterium]|jgi:acyl-CoA synthetase (AMP-forming)/AMP-acid ligase II|nr:MAG: long-chain acyl-CoA synthetase [Chloroflexota bacterium]